MSFADAEQSLAATPPLPGQSDGRYPGGCTEAEPHMLARSIAEAIVAKRSLGDDVREQLEAMSATDFGAVVTYLDESGTLRQFLKGQRQEDTPRSPSGDQGPKFEIPLVCYRLWGVSERRVEKDLEYTNQLFGAHGIRVYPAYIKEITEEDVARVGFELGGLPEKAVLEASLEPRRIKRGFGVLSEDELQQLMIWWTFDNNFNRLMDAVIPKSVIGVLWAQHVSFDRYGKAGGFATVPQLHGRNHPMLAVISADRDGAAGRSTLAHELGHILMNTGHRSYGLMKGNRSRSQKRSLAPEQLDEIDTEIILGEKLGWYRH